MERPHRSVQGGKTGTELLNLIIGKFPGTVDPCRLQVSPDFRVFFNIHETEDQPLGKGSDSVAYSI